jgi:hypothetical protein
MKSISISNFLANINNFFVSVESKLGSDDSAIFSALIIADISRRFIPPFFIFFVQEYVRDVDKIKSQISLLIQSKNNNRPTSCVVFLPRTTNIKNFSEFNGVIFLHFVQYDCETHSVQYEKKIKYFLISRIFKAIKLFEKTLEDDSTI